MVDQIKKALPDMWRNSPPWFALMAVVVLFLVYLDRQEERAINRERRLETLSDLRIKQCHDIQQKSTQAIEKLNATLSQQVVSLDRLKVIIERQ